ncbi:MAG: FxLYD domain-containing protein [Anaerolineae bacterium]
MKQHRSVRALVLILVIALISISLTGCEQVLQQALKAMVTAAPSEQAGAGGTSKEQPTKPSATVKPTVKATTAPTSAPKATAKPKLTSAPKPSATPEPQAGDVVLLEQGWSQQEDAVGYAFIVQNKSANANMGEISYQVVFYGADDSVLGTEENSIALILPGQKLGIGNSTNITDKIARMEVKLSKGQVVETAYTKEITTGRVNFIPIDTNVYVLGTVTNPFEEDLEGVQVFAVLRDSAGKIIGGGANSLPFMNRASTMGQEIYSTAAGQVASVELYAEVFYAAPWSDTTAARAGSELLSAPKVGFSQTESSVSYAALIKNASQRAAVSTQVWATLYDAADNVVGVFYNNLSVILPGETQAVTANTMLDDSTARVAYIEVQVYGAAMEDAPANLPSFSADNITWIPDEWSPTVTGEVYNPYDREIQWVTVNAVLYNADGAIVGGGSGNIDFIPAKDSAAVEVWCSQMSEEPASIELYASAGYLSDLTGEQQ